MSPVDGKITQVFCSLKLFLIKPYLLLNILPGFHFVEASGLIFVIFEVFD